jgi:hypothetical protein
MKDNGDGPRSCPLPSPILQFVNADALIARTLSAFLSVAGGRFSIFQQRAYSA